MLHLVQLWIAQPDADRNGPPAFDHHAERPVFEARGGRATVVLGALGGVDAPARTFSPLVAAEIAVDRGGELRSPSTAGSSTRPGAAGRRAGRGRRALALEHLCFLETGRDSVVLRAGGEPARALLIGGAPFAESILMWWNFVARTTNEIVAARDDWQAGRRFGEMRAYAGERLPAPRFLARPVPANPMS